MTDRYMHDTPALKEDFKCEICDAINPHFEWCDTHGIAVCSQCGNPYRLFHYEGEKRVDKPPESLTKEEFKPIMRQYWEETKTRQPKPFCIPGSSYDPTTVAQVKAYNQWMEEQLTQRRILCHTNRTSVQRLSKLNKWMSVLSLNGKVRM